MSRCDSQLDICSLPEVIRIQEMLAARSAWIGYLHGKTSRSEAMEALRKAKAKPGGCGVLDLARAGAPLRGVVSLHGILSTPMPAHRSAVQAKILVLHGDADPLAPFDQLAAFRNDIRSAETNWEISLYGDARHSFTGEGIIDQGGPEAGVHPQSESRSWRTMLEFLAEALK